jgi:MinD superfamily P-loop ATPase
LITFLRVKGEEAAIRQPDRLLLLDGSPGLGCQVIASLAGCDLAVIVSEPGKGALHDLERIRQLLDFFRIAGRVVINRFDLDLSLTREVERYCRDSKLPVAGKIPFDPSFMEAALSGRPAVDLDREELNRNLEGIYRGLRKVLYGL